MNTEINNKKVITTIKSNQADGYILEVTVEFQHQVGLYPAYIQLTATKTMPNTKCTTFAEIRIVAIDGKFKPKRINTENYQSFTTKEQSSFCSAVKACLHLAKLDDEVPDFLYDQMKAYTVAAIESIDY